MKKYLVSAHSDDILFEQTIYATSEDSIVYGEGVTILGIRTHPNKDGFWKRIIMRFRC